MHQDFWSCVHLSCCAHVSPSWPRTCSHPAVDVVSPEHQPSYFNSLRLEHAYAVACFTRQKGQPVSQRQMDLQGSSSGHLVLSGLVIHNQHDLGLLPTGLLCLEETRGDKYQAFRIPYVVNGIITLLSLLLGYFQDKNSAMGIISTKRRLHKFKIIGVAFLVFIVSTIFELLHVQAIILGMLVYVLLPVLIASSNDRLISSVNTKHPKTGKFITKFQRLIFRDTLVTPELMELPSFSMIEADPDSIETQMLQGHHRTVQVHNWIPQPHPHRLLDRPTLDQANGHEENISDQIDPGFIPPPSSPQPPSP